MTANIVQAQYDDMRTIAERFAKQSEENRTLYQRVMRGVGALEDGGWEGRGAAAFFGEMDRTLFPGLQHLQEALREAQAVTLNVDALMRAAEEQAAALFNGEQPLVGLGGGVAAAVKGAGVSVREGSGENGSTYVGTERNGPEVKVFRTSKLGFPYAVEGELAGAKVYGGTTIGMLPIAGSAKVAAGSFGAGFKAGLGEKGLPTAGVYAEAAAATASAKVVAGDENLGLTAEGKVKVLSAEGFAGIEDGSLDAHAGVTLASVRGEVGANIAGANVGVNGEVGLKAELGVKVGPETEVKLPFVSFGVSFGKAKKGDE